MKLDLGGKLVRSVGWWEEAFDSNRTMPEMQLRGTGIAQGTLIPLPIRSGEIDHCRRMKHAVVVWRPN